MKSLLVMYSYHHKNTEKLATVFASILDAPIKSPHEITPDVLEDYDLIGFGSGIYDGKHHKFLMDLVQTLPINDNKKAFLFSTDGTPRGLMKNDSMLREKMLKDHAILREKLQSRGYIIVGEFNCAGFNTNSFLKLFGGVNKGRPNAEDLQHAAEFAQNLKA
jgi:flavodoxin